MSARVHEAIGRFSDEIENYSIDEAFAKLEVNRYSKPLFDLGVEIKASVKKWTGIPTSIGIAPTKTLAKIAGDVAKQSPHGVFDLSDELLRDEVLAQTDIIDVWGINKRTAKKLQELGIYSAKHLRDLDLRAARKAITVVGARLVEELRGHSCLPLEFVAPLKKSICCSRSFSGEVFSRTEMAESVISYLSTAAEKLRKHRLIATALNLFIETNRFREKGLYVNNLMVKISPTDSTRELIGHALRLLNAIYKPGFGYRKSGVILLGLQPRKGETKRLFHDDLYLRDRDLMGAVDAINEKHGRQTIRFGMPIKDQTNWHMNRNFLSPCYTTDIDQILQVHL